MAPYHDVMLHTLRFGAAGAVEIDLPEEAWLADCGASRKAPLGNVAQATVDALAEPLEYPPLARAIVPGDRVALAIERGVPQATEVIAGVVAALGAAGVQPADITLVYAPGDKTTDVENLTASLPAEMRDELTTLVHDPLDQPNLCFLGAAKDGRPMYLNRAICEADVAIPIGSLRLEESLGYFGVYGGLYPTFADDAARQRYRAPISTDAAVHQRRRREEADEAAWMLGSQLIVQVVPGPGDTVLNVLAGESHAVTKRGKKHCAAAWRFKVPRRASLVVAGVEGGPEQQTWENFARALFAASQVVAEDGAIVICTELKCQPEASLRRLMSTEGASDARHEILRDRTSDAISASLLVEARERARVYLLSDLGEEVVEDLGLGHVSQVEEVARLSRQHESCILISGAQHAVAVAE